MPQDIRQWATASHPGDEPATVALRECVIAGVFVNQAMLPVCGETVTHAAVQNAIHETESLLNTLRTLDGYAKG